MSPRAPFVAAAILAAANMLYGLIIFPETLSPDRRRSFDWRRANPLGALRTMRSLPGMGGIAVVFVLWQIASLVYPMTELLLHRAAWLVAGDDRREPRRGRRRDCHRSSVCRRPRGRTVRRTRCRDAGDLRRGRRLYRLCLYHDNLGRLPVADPGRTAGAGPAVADGDDVAPRNARDAGRVQGFRRWPWGWPARRASAPHRDDGLVHRRQGAGDFPGAAFIVAAIFGLLAIAMLRRLPPATRIADQMPPSVTA
jgi:DHA1 family tetracycline resistance protein-like MFS transporter